jgi:hypothetical protein
VATLRSPKTALRLRPVDGNAIPPRPVVAKVDDLNSCYITVECEGELIFLVLLARDGSVNRLGDGSYPPPDKVWHIGRVDEPLFDRLLEVVTDAMLQYAGSYDVPDKVGTECECKIVFGTKQGGATGFEIKYGTESAGVPTELQNIVRRAIELTDAWWKAQPGKAS